uniref:Transmembrane protein n=1 Tax=Lepeophtheirus salmonis TaxID=72036 RepID=A0A0K2V2X9_LEPSM
MLEKNKLLEDIALDMFLSFTHLIGSLLYLLFFKFSRRIDSSSSIRVSISFSRCPVGVVSLFKSKRSIRELLRRLQHVLLLGNVFLPGVFVSKSEW